MSSEGMVLATAMALAAVSAGTLILLALGHQKLFSPTQIIHRSCISSDGKRRKKKKKKVKFAEDVVEPSGNTEEFRKQHRNINSSSSTRFIQSSATSKNNGKNRGMPANRVALYNGILRDRVVHRLAYSY